MDQMVLQTQQWLNKTYGDDTRYTKVKESGHTGWDTINGLIVALQIELGIQHTAANFGAGTTRKFNQRYPHGVKQQDDSDESKSNVYSIIQGALWCKGYSTSNNITQHFYSGTGRAVKELKNDMGIGGDSTVTIDVMKALLSMQQFVLLNRYGGTDVVRIIQQTINRTYKNYTGIIPCDGLYGREMNTALIQILQSLEGYSPDDATGNFGHGTRRNLKTISRQNASSYGKWVWLAKAVLNCIRYDCLQNENWDDDFAEQLTKFQKDYKLPVSGALDVNTWMSLLTSKGNPDRPAKACDTRFEITSELLNTLKRDGYEIVGRYLTGGSFKEIREGELKRIVDGGLKYFPIFQENGRNLSDFTYQKGLEHGKKASEAALSKGVPATAIYFAVDMDIYDYQIDSNIIPYFKGINETIDSRYSVGIYASRNVCTRISNVGLSASSFVSDMSTGFSGNLGFPIPKNWNYDQFHEISGYGGKWDLDKVAYNGKIPACNSVNTAIKYVPNSYLPKEVDVKNMTPTIFEAIDLVKKLEQIYSEYQKEKLIRLDRHVSMIYRGVLNFLSKKYLKGYSNFSIAVTPFDEEFDEYFKSKHSEFYNLLQKFIKQEISDTKVGLNDLQHWAVTTLAYTIWNTSPDSWVGWAGDLATGMRTLHKYIGNYPDLDVRKSAISIIGAYPPYSSDYFISKGIIMNSEENGNECHFIDLCDDADAIGVSRILKTDNGVNNLSDAMRTYYSSVTKSKRYLQYARDGLDFTDINSLTRTIKYVMNSVLTNLPRFGLNTLKGGATEQEQNACCYAFAYYLMRHI